MQYVQLSQPPAPTVIGDLIKVGAEVAQHENTFWIRLPSQTADQDAVLSKLVGQHWIGDQSSRADGADRSALRQHGALVPTASLPAKLQWTTVDQFFRFAMPTPGIGSQCKQSAQLPILQLERGGEPRTAEALLVSMQDLADWVPDAAAVRLQALRWIRNGQQALLWGHPLPPLEGVALVVQDQVFVPAGFQWQPPLPAVSVRNAFCALEQREPSESCVIWEATDRWCIIHENDWTALTRDSVRLVVESETLR